MGLAPVQRNIKLAHIFFGWAAIWFYGAALEWLMKTGTLSMPKPFIAFLVCGLIGASWMWAYGWVEKNHQEAGGGVQNGELPQNPPEKKPEVQQSSQGANSPNIVGSNNTVNIGDPKVAARLDEITKLLKAQGDQAKPEELLKEYPLGYVIFETDYESSVFPYQSRAFDNWDFDFSAVRVTPRTADKVTLTFPSIKPKPGKSGPTIIGATTSAPKHPGPLGVKYIFVDRASDLALGGKVLAVKDNRLVFVIGFTHAPK
jgi:hypothetical protein